MPATELVPAASWMPAASVVGSTGSLKVTTTLGAADTRVAPAAGDTVVTVGGLVSAAPPVVKLQFGVLAILPDRSLMLLSRTV